MNRLILSGAVTLIAATPFLAHSADAPERAERAENLNRFSLGARFGMNFKASFRNNTVVPVPFVPNAGPATGGLNHNYDDGYVLLDSSGNAGGTTWNWGYQNASQVAGDTMQFHVTQSTPPNLAANRNLTGDPQFGAELNYQRVLGHLSSSSSHWGFEAALGGTEIDLRDNRTAKGLTTLTTDTFPLNGVIPPGPGYNGTFVGPGPLLGDTPVRTTATTLDSRTSRQKLSGRLYSIRLGPFAEWNFTPEFGVALSGGLTLAPASVAYSFTDTATVNGVTTVASGRTSKTELLYGPYASALLRYDFNERWGVYAGAQFQRLTDMDQTIGARTARLNQGFTVYGVAGVSWKF